MKPPKLTKRVIWTVVVFIAWVVVGVVFNEARGPIEARIAVQQLNDSIAGYSFARAVASGAISKVIGWTGTILLLIIWIPYVVRWIRYDNAREEDELED